MLRFTFISFMDVTAAQCVYCAVRTGSVCMIEVSRGHFYMQISFYCPSSYKLQVQCLSVHTPPFPNTLPPRYSSSLSPTVFCEVAKTREVNGLCVNPAVTPGVKCSALAIESISISAADCSRAALQIRQKQLLLPVLLTPVRYRDQISNRLSARVFRNWRRVHGGVGDSVLGLFCVTATDCTGSCDPGCCLTKKRTVESSAVAFKLCEDKELLP